MNASSEAILDYTDHFEGAAEAWQDAEILDKDQSAAVTAALLLVSKSAVGLRKLTIANDAADRAATRARARYKVRDVILDQRVMGANDALLNGLCNREHAHPKYRYVMDNDRASAITSAKIREEPEIAAAMLVRYNKVDDFPGKQAAGDLLGDAIAKSLQVRAEVEAAEKAGNDAGTDELYARLEVRKALEQAYGMLVAAFPGQRAFVESFFLKRERPTKAEPAPATPPPTPDS